MSDEPGALVGLYSKKPSGVDGVQKFIGWSYLMFATGICDRVVEGRLGRRGRGPVGG